MCKIPHYRIQQSYTRGFLAGLSIVTYGNLYCHDHTLESIFFYSDSLTCTIVAFCTWYDNKQHTEMPGGEEQIMQTIQTFKIS